VPNPPRHRPVQKENPNIKKYFAIIDARGGSAQDKQLLKDKILDQMIRKNEYIIEETEEEIVSP